MLPVRALAARVLEVAQDEIEVEDAGSERNDLLAHGGSRKPRRRAGVDRLAARESADPLRDRRGVARGHDNVAHGAAHFIGNDLRQRRDGALPLRGRAGCDRNLAVGQDAHGDALERTQPRALDVVGDPDAEVAPLRAGRALARAKVLVAGELERALLAPREISAGVDERLAVAEREPDGVGHLIRTNHVAAAHLARIERKGARDAVDEPFHGKHRLRPAGAAHHRGRYAIGERHAELEPIGGHPIGSGDRGCRDIGRDDPPRQEGSGVVQQVAP